MKPLTRFLALLAMSVSMAAAAHAFLEHALPAVGSTVKAPPARVQLWFSEELEPAFSSVKVMGPDGKQVDKGDKQLDRSQRGLMAVSLPALAPGRYRVVWRALSVDTHVTEGDFVFDIAP